MDRVALVLFGVVLGLSLVPFPASAGSAPSITSPFVQAAIVSAVQKDRKIFGGRTPVPAVLVGVWDRAGHTYIHAFGYADLATKLPLSPADHFRIGSNTKTFVVATILQLVDERRMRLDDTIGRFKLGLHIPNENEITVRELCDMRSGLFEAYNTPQMAKMNVTGSTKFDPRTLIRWASEQKPVFAPNADYRYTNTNYLILGEIIRKVTGHDPGMEIADRFIKPFNLTQTSFPTTEAMPSPWAHGYGLDKKRNWVDVSNTIPVSLMWTAGAMISDMNDMRRWIKLHVTGKTSGPSTHRAMLNCVPIGHTGVAFGLGIGCTEGWYGYTGGLPGYNTADYYFPKADLTIVAWVTLQADRPSPGVANAIFRDISRILTPSNVGFGNPKSDWSKYGL